MTQSIKKQEILNSQKHQGLVSEIQRYSVHDGPGIRTVVFLKGCPLTCPWCCNPELKNPLPVIGYHIGKCIGCHSCVSACPEKAIKIDTNGIYLDRNRCNACGFCVESCPSGALRLHGKIMSVEEVIKVVSRDRLFYNNSGGGVTISGGEPFFQADFLITLLSTFKQYSINTAIETTGYVQWPIMNKALRYLDFLLFDFKIFNREKHLQVLGVDNEIIKQNLIRSSKKGIPILARIPIIPGFTDDSENINQIGQFLTTINNIQSVHILPYHRIGLSKYRQIGEPYLLDQVEIPSREKIVNIAAVLKSYQLPVVIGG
ncbi:glycyl-radical enzyme activating protein [Atribacter laminatus]|uniref:Benzylsuccinate synthase activating enzyme n=1 Tax=Atribacter laminatus TaxID=2847778 RepID=A0A7T1F421_ATRLM|nr:glycyl-radical enzyme activating protein [Atribacter laminatus]QPM69010.1 Benzylsuccinate synthase activating enzyme [Atribacter laminatus]